MACSWRHSCAECDPNIAALQAYTIDLLKEIEIESGHNIGLHRRSDHGGTPDRWEWLQQSIASSSLSALMIAVLLPLKKQAS